MKKTERKKGSGKNAESFYLRQIEALSEISKAITSDRYLEDILRLIVTVTANVLNSKICSLLLLDEEKNELVIRATQSVSEAYNRKPNMRVGQGVAGRVFQEKRPMIINDVRKSPLYMSTEIAKREGLCSLLCVPLIVKGRSIGVLNSYTSVPHKFTRAEVEVLSAVANQAAIVIEHAQLLVRSRVIQEELETRKYVERAKGILMQSQGLSEEAAFQKIRRKSMDARRSMREIAEAIILAKEIEK